MANDSIRHFTPGDSGFPQKRALDESRSYLPGIDHEAHPQEGSLGTLPRSPMEQWLATFLEPVLGSDLDVLQYLPEAALDYLHQPAFQAALTEQFGVTEAPLLPGPCTAAAMATHLERKVVSPKRAHLPQKASGVLKMSPYQMRMWFFHHLEGPTATFNLSSQLSFTGPFSVAALDRAYTSLVSHHQTPRAYFPEHQGQPDQRLVPIEQMNLCMIDLSGIDRPEELASPSIHQHSIRPFSLAEGPLTRLLLVRVSPTNHQLVLTQHRIITDRTSAGLFLEDLALRYRAALTGTSEESPCLHYGDFAQWQTDYMVQESSRLEQFWREQLADCPERHQFPMDRARPTCQRFRGQREPFQIGIRTREGLTELASREGTDLWTVIQAAFTAFLGRYSQSEDIMLGTVFSFREESPLFQKVLGPFNNFLVLRHKIRDLRFTDFLHQVRRSHDLVLAHRDLPFEKVVELVQPQRDLSQAPLFQFFLQTRDPLPAPPFPGLTAQPKTDHIHVSLFDLSLVLEKQWDEEGLLVGYFEFNPDLFEAETVSRFSRHFKVMLRSLVQTPYTRLPFLPLLTQDEQETILTDWNTTAINFGPRICIHDLFQRQVHQTPLAAALMGLSPVAETLAYDELNRWSNQIAFLLRGFGVGPETTVGLCGRRSPGQVASLLGVLKAGAAVLGLPPDFPQERLGFMIADARVQVLILDEETAHLFPDFEGHVLQIPARSAETRFRDNPVGNVRDYNRALVVYTSGTEGVPRGVVLSHRALVNRLRWAQEVYPFHAEDRFLQIASIHFDVSFWEILAPLICGAQLVLPQPEVHKDLRDLMAVVSEQRITALHFIPNLLHNFLHVLARGALPHLRLVFCGGETLALTTIHQFYEKLSARLIHFYGPTEAAINVTSVYCRPDWTKVSIGRPIANTSAYVLDHYLHPVPPGVVGELYLGGVCLSSGYENKPRQTAAAFIPNPFSGEHPFAGAGSRLYRTGDLARLGARGKIYFQGRRDRQVKLNGFRVELAEIERCLLRLDDVRDCVLECLHSDGSTRVVAYIEAEPEAQLTPAGVRTFLLGVLPNYMVPSLYVILPHLPRFANGKVNPAMLSLPQHLAQSTEVAYVPPRTREEHVLASLWAEILGREHVGIHDNFFQLGGDSMLVVRMEALAASAGLAVSTQQLFQGPTIAQVLASLVHDNERLVEASALVFHLFEKQVIEQPLAAAVLLAGEPLWLTYAQLHQAVLIMASRLRQIGMGPGSVVGVCAGPKTALIGYLAVLKTGATCLPLDIDTSAERRQQLAEAAGMNAALIDHSASVDFTHVPLLLIQLDGPAPVYAQWPQVLDGSIAFLSPTLENQLIEISHQHLLRAVLNLAAAPGLEPDACVLSLRQEIPLWSLWPLCAGARLVVSMPAEQRDPESINRLIQKYAPTTVVCGSAGMGLFLEGLRGPDSLRLVVDGELAIQDGRSLLKRFRQVWRLFGQEEVGTVCAYDLLQPGLIQRDSQMVGISAPHQGAWLYLLDPRLNPVRPGQLGELFIGGKLLPLGYRAQTKEVAAHLVPDPFSKVPGQRLLRTGRRALFLEDGHIVFA